MFNKNTVRSLLAFLAMTGLLSACGSQSNQGDASASEGALNYSGDAKVLSSEVTQEASVEVLSITDASGVPVSIESQGLTDRLGRITKAIVKKETIQVGNDLRERAIVELSDGQQTIASFESDVNYMVLSLLSSDLSVTGAMAEVADGKIQSLEISVVDGHPVNVVFLFGAEQDQPKQDEPKQDQPKQDQPKQDQPKQDQPKQDQPKQDQPKQDQPKQDEPKQDEPKQDEPKQDEPKQDEPKQDEPKQDEPKQDEPKQDEPKQDMPKQDEPKQDEPKQDMPKQDEPKQGLAGF